jgi:hypothetical protein
VVQSWHAVTFTEEWGGSRDFSPPHVFLKGFMEMIDYALRADPQPEVSYHHPAPPCPQHTHGDEARLDFRAAGWPGGECKQHRGKCKATWRESVLCDALFQEYFCAKSLPDVLRRLTQPSSLKASATLGTVTARAAGVAKPRGVSAHALKR